MAFSSIRHQSLLIIFTMIITNKYIGNYLFEKEINQNIILEKKFTSKKGILLTLIITILLGLPMVIRNLNTDYIKKDTYPVDTVNYIKSNLNYKNIRIFNNIDIGSYLILNDIKVFIDSRTDLYTKIYNKKEDIFNDYIDTMQGKNYYENIFTKYNINYILLKKDSWLSIYLNNDENYTIEYSDKYFILYKRNTMLIKN